MGRIGDFGNPEPGVTQPGALAAHRAVNALAGNVENDARFQHPVHRGGDRHRVLGIAVQEVGGSVQGIHDPDQAALDRAGIQFLSYHRGTRGAAQQHLPDQQLGVAVDRKSTRLNSSHLVISYAVFYLKKKTVGADKLSKITDYTDRQTAILFDDGAGAVVIGEVYEGRGSLSYELESDGPVREYLY